MIGSLVACNGVDLQANDLYIREDDSFQPSRRSQESYLPRQAELNRRFGYNGFSDDSNDVYPVLKHRSLPDQHALRSHPLRRRASIGPLRLAPPVQARRRRQLRQEFARRQLLQRRAMAQEARAIEARGSARDKRAASPAKKEEKKPAAPPPPKKEEKPKKTKEEKKIEKVRSR